MNDRTTEALRQVRALMDEYRVQCLWFLREDFYPQSPEDACRVLEQIERHGDVAAFRKAAPLRLWLSQNSSAASAA